jgi:PAS domain S-box-containing protein
MDQALLFRFYPGFDIPPDKSGDHPAGGGASRKKLAMSLTANTAWQKRLEQWSRYLVYAVLCIGVLVLIGWELEIVLLKKVYAHLSSMNPLTAICFILISFSFLIGRLPQASNTRRGVGYSLAGLVILVGLVKIAGMIFHFDSGIDQIIFKSKVGLEQRVASRMAPNTSLCFIFSGIALILLKYKSQRRTLAQYMAIAIALISLLSLLGYLYQVESFYGLFSYVAMALNTASCFFLFALAILFSNTETGIMKELSTDLTGSVAARILIPVAIIVPAALGLIRLWGYWNGVYNNEFGVALYALITIIILVAIIWYNTISLNKRDLLRKSTENALQASEEQSRGIFDNAPDSIVLMDERGMIVKWNPPSEKLFGYKAREVTGKYLNDVIIPNELRKVQKRSLTELLEGNDSGSVDLWAVRKDGSEVDISLRLSPLSLNDKQFFIVFMRDITERKLIEKKMRGFNEELAKQVEEKTTELTDIFERVTDGFIALDKDFRYLYVNKKAGELIHRNPQDLIGKKVWEIFPDAVGSETYQSFHHAMKEQIYISSTDYYAPLNLWQENHIYPSANGLSIFIRDITERKQAEQAINEARNLADKLIDSLPGVFYFYDQHGKFIRWNKQFENVTGYSGAEIAEMHPSDFFTVEEKEYITGRIQTVFLEGENDAQADFVTKSGVKIPYYFKAVKIIFQGEPCLLGYGVDVTERVKAEDRIKASEKKYKLLFESNPLPMWMLSLPGYEIKEVNDAALEQYGYSRKEFLALDIFTIRPDEDIEKLKAMTIRDYRGIHHSGIWRHQKKNGAIIYVDVVTHDIYYEDSPTRLVLANEVTEQYLAEEKLKESYDATRKLTEHLQNVREEERLHIAREIHDELGQLLTVLKMDVSWLNKKIENPNGPVKEKLADLLALIDTTVKTVRRIASELRPSLIDDLGLWAAMEWHLEEFEKRSGITKKIELPAVEMPLPDALKIGLFRIFQESLTNVARHSGAKNVSVNLHEKDSQLVLTIKDDGKGLDEERTNKKTLGLLGMKERTLMMGGEYNITSAGGKGTTVTVTVPLAQLENKN